MQVINLLDVLGDSAKEEEIVEGMEAEEEAEGGEEEVEYDEHVWLSLNNASIFVDAIEEALAAVDSANSDAYKANADSYKSELSALNNQYEEVVSSASGDTVLFGDRFPFRYMVDDYGLNYYAAFVGCSAETEASFETITFLAGKVDELGLKSVLTIENSDNKIAETIIENTADKDAKILALDSMQSTTSTDASYLDIMKSNLDVLREALDY
jgi:zinc transport system substrate-binding protein